MDSSYFQNFFDWLAIYQQWIFVAVFVTAFVESFAVVGILVPGVALLFGIALVAASAGVSAIPILAAAFGGAVCGDSISFFIGRHFHDKIRQLPPFSAHPEWIIKGERFFLRHGAISIVAGRFIGPLRPLIPMIAGMFQMSPTKFITINCLSALVWAPTYIVPGYLVGLSLDQSYGLQHQHALFILSLVGFIWLVNYSLNIAVKLSEKLKYYIKSTYPETHLTHSTFNRLPVLSITNFVLCGSLFFILSVAVKLDLMNSVNEWVHGQFLSIRHPWIDPPLIAITEFGDLKPMALTGLLIVIFFLIQRWWSTAINWLAVLISSPFIIFGLKSFFGVERPNAIVTPPTSLAFPSGHTTIITLLGGFMALVLLHHAPAKYRNKIIQTAVVLITLIAVSRLYLGVHWFSDVLGGVLLAMTILSLSQIAYFKLPVDNISLSRAVISIAMAMLISISVYVIPNHSQAMLKFKPLDLTPMNPAYQHSIHLSDDN